MSEQEKSGNISGNISGNVNGQAAIGTRISQTQTVGAAQLEVTQADSDELLQMLANLKAQVKAEAPPGKKDAALGRVEELEEAVKEPDLDTMGGVKRWFVKNLPSLAGAVTSIVINPIVGKLVAVAGDDLAAEYNHRFIGK